MISWNERIFRLDDGSRVSVVVTAFNAELWILEVLQSLLSQTYPADLVEIVVVDDGSRDGTRALVSDLISTHKQIRLIAQENRGTAAALTTGLRAARGEFVFVLSHDCYAAKDWLANAVEVFHTNSHIGIVQGKVLPTHPTDLLFYHCTPLYRPTRSFPTVAIAYRASAIEKAGCYFEQVFSRYGDDTDMAWRILEQDHTSAWLDEVTAYHEIVPGSPWKSIRACLGMVIVPLLIKRHPGLRRRLRLGMFWGGPYRYLKMAGVHGMLLSLMIGWQHLALISFLFTLIIAWYESLALNRLRPIALWHKLFTLPLHLLVTEFLVSYAFLIGSIRWRSLLL